LTINVKTKCNLYVAWFHETFDLSEMSNLGFERLRGKIDVSDVFDEEWNLEKIVRKEVQQGNTITLKTNFIFLRFAIFVK